MLAGLLSGSRTMPLDQLPATVTEHAAAAGFTEAEIYLGDLERRALHLLTGPDEHGWQATAEEETAVRIDGTVAGRAYQYGRILEADRTCENLSEWWVPMYNGNERLGVLHLSSTDDRVVSLEDMGLLGSLVGLIIASKRGHSDAYARLTRTQPMNVAAETQWQLMPPRSYADGRVVLCATLEPAYRISGDAYDYATSGPIVHLAVFDAMGHDTAAGLTATLAVGASRNARRRGAGIIETGDAVEHALTAQFDDVRYTTAVLAYLDTRTGVLTWTNHGHQPPLVIRRGRMTTLLQCPPSHPLGTNLDLETTICREQLQPGDRIVLYTDGITEARRPGGSEFGISRFIAYLTRYHADGLSVPETVRRAVHALLDYHNGSLQDDATLLLCDWLGPVLASEVSNSQ